MDLRRHLFTVVLGAWISAHVAGAADPGPGTKPTPPTPAAQAIDAPTAREIGQVYRVAVSSLWKELILWRPSGGVVQMAPYPFEAGKSYALAVGCQGPHFRVTLDGRELIGW